MSQGFFVALVFLLIAAAGVFGLARSANRQKEQREAEWQAGALAHGWSFETHTDGAFQLMRWQGQTDGVSWTLEYRRGRHKHRSTADRAQRVRWWADVFQGPSAPVFCMAMKKGQEDPAVKLAQGGGALAKLAQKVAGAALDTTLDVYFGEDAGRQVDARTLKPVEGTAQSGYIVMAEDGVAASRWLADGQGAALNALVSDGNSPMHSDVGRPWVLWVGRRVMLANTRPLNGNADVERMVDAGLALARS